MIDPSSSEQKAEQWLQERESVTPNYQDFPEESEQYDRQSNILRHLLAEITRLRALKDEAQTHCRLFGECVNANAVREAEAETQRLRAEVEELRDRDRVLSHQLELRAGGRDAFTQSLIAAEDAALTRAEAAEARLREIQAKLDAPDNPVAPVSFASVMDGIDSRHLQDTIYDLVIWHIWHIRRGDAAEAKVKALETDAQMEWERAEHAINLLCAAELREKAKDARLRVIAREMRQPMNGRYYGCQCQSTIERWAETIEALISERKEHESARMDSLS